MEAHHKISTLLQHIVVDAHQPRTAALDQPDDVDLSAVPRWMRYGMKKKKLTGLNGIAVVLQPVPRPGEDAIQTSNMAAEIRCKTRATTESWNRLRGDGKPTKQAVQAAIAMMVREEALHWNNNELFIEAALERGSVLTSDDLIVSQLYSKGSDAVTNNNSNFLTRLQKCEVKVVEFVKNPGHRQVPDIQATASVLESLKKNLDACEQTMPLVLAFSVSYQDLAFHSGQYGLFQFCKWASEQHSFHQKLFNNRKGRYEAVCKSCKRHPATPKEPASWPPPVPTDDDAALE